MSHKKLRELLVDVFLLEPSEYHCDLKRDEVNTWDSLGVVSMAVGIQDTFGYHMTPDEATSITGVRDIIQLLKSKGISFDDDEA